MPGKRIVLILCLLLMPLLAWAEPIDALFIKQNDKQPYYYAQIKDAANAVVNITGATIYCTMKNLNTGTTKIDRQTTGINISDGINGKFEYRWQSTDTNTVGTYSIEFEINPLTGGKYTVPTRKQAVIVVEASLDNQ